MIGTGNTSTNLVYQALLDILVFQHIGFDLDRIFITKLLTKTFQCQSTDTKVLLTIGCKKSGTALFFAGIFTPYEVHKRAIKKYFTHLLEGKNTS